MANKIVFESSLDATGFERGMKVMEARAASASGRMNRTVYEQNKGVSNLSRTQIEARAEYEARIKHKASVRMERFLMQQRASGAMDHNTETAYAGSAAGRGAAAMRRSRFAIAGSMFTSVARDSAASLASGAPVTQVIAQQAPQVAQAFTMMGFAISRLVPVMAVAGTALAIFYYWMQKISAQRLEQQSQNDLTESQGMNRSRLFKLIEKNRDRLRPGEADAMRKVMAGAVARAGMGGDMEANKELLLTDQAVRQRLREVNLSDEQLKKMADLGELSRRFLVESLTGKDRERAAADENYRERKKQIAELGKDAKTLADLNDVQSAYEWARKAHETTLEQIDKPAAEKDAKNNPGRAPSSDSLVAVGNFLGTSRNKVDALASQQVDLMQRYLPQIEMNTRRVTAEASSYPVN